MPFLVLALMTLTWGHCVGLDWRWVYGVGVVWHQHWTQGFGAGSILVLCLVPGVDITLVIFAQAVLKVGAFVESLCSLAFFVGVVRRSRRRF